MSLEASNPYGEFESRLRFETLIADLSLKFVDMPAEHVDQEIMDAQRRICETLGLDLAGLWQWSEQEGDFKLSHLYSIEKGPLPLSPTWARESYPWCHQQMRAGRTISISSLEELPAEAAIDRESACSLGIKSNLTIPLSVGRDTLLGAMAFSTFQAEWDWPGSTVKRLQLIAQIFANALGRKRAEKALRETDEINRATFEQAAMGIAHVGIDGRWLRVNDKLCAIVGYSREELMHLTFEDITCPDDVGTDLEYMRQALSGKIKTYSMEKRYIRKDHSLVWINLTVSMVRSATGERRHFISIVEDITERKRAESAFRASEARLSAAADLVDLGCYEVDLGESYCFVDERFAEICGVPPDRRTNLQAVHFWMEHIHPDDRQRVLDERQQLHSGLSGRVTVEYRYMHPAQGQKWIHHVGRVSMRNAAGIAVRTFGIVRDITAQKRGEKEVEELRNNLVHMTRVNTMSVLSGSLAHELNQPLGIILTNAQAAQDMLLEEQPDIAEVQAALTSIIAADRRAGDVIRQLRALLKRGQLAIKLLSLNEVIEEVLHLAHSDLIGRGVSVVHELAQDLPAVPGDRVHLQQLVLNLLLNGAEAMADNEPGSRRIYLRTEAKGNVVHFSVRDEGCGLPPDTNQIFDPFFTTKREGLGMGLPICSSIVAAHNGRIWAEPGLDRGAAFHVELPVTEIQENK